MRFSVSKALLFLLPTFGLVIVVAFVVNSKNEKDLTGPPSDAHTNLIPEVDAEESVETVSSPDALFELTMEKSRLNGDESSTFSVKDIENDKSLIIFESTDEGLALSPNAFSPDDRYVFIEKNSSGSSALVFRTDGSTFLNDEGFIDVEKIFKEKDLGLKLTNVTGWDSPTLLHLFTENSDGSRGPSYWFEVPGGGVYRLSTY